MKDSIRFNINGSFLEPNATIEKQKKRLHAVWDPKADAVELDLTYLFNSPDDPHPISKQSFESVGRRAEKALADLKAGKGDIHDKGVPMIGWQDLPENLTTEHINAIRTMADELSDKIDAFVSLGIGGSYLGIEATIRALSHTSFNQLTREQRGGAPEIHFLGQNLDPDFFRDTLDLLQGKRVGVNVISKSGTTIETAVAFRIFRTILESIAGAGASELIVATTDLQKGALRTLVEQKGYASLVVPDDIGGRFSVLTDVGLFGIAMAGIDISAFVAGFADMRKRTQAEDLWQNPALLHATARVAAWECGKKIEVVATNSSHLLQVGRFMEQLFPESEGHDQKGMWVSPSLYSEKLHANGQMVQQGERNILETFLMLDNHDNKVPIPSDPDNTDGLNYISERGWDMNFLNRLVVEGPAYAHFIGGAPNMTIRIPRRSAYCLGQLYYMFERSVAISGILLGHNPFIQPGVEDYKKAMFAMAGKPGTEQEKLQMAENIDKIKNDPS